MTRTHSLHRPAGAPGSRRSLLISGGSALLLLAGCAASADPEKLGDARALWNERRARQEPKATLTVDVSNVRAGRGVVRVGLYDASTPFPLEGAGLSTSSVAAITGTTTLRFDAIPFGTYALAAYQDLDGNGRLNTNLGVPSEPYGFSSGAAAGLAGAPSFRRASFEIDGPVIRQAIRL